MPIELTDEQKQRRAETARLNGRKSQGPKTAAGKYISSLNAITTGARADVHDAALPAGHALLTTDDRRSWVRLLQEQVRQFRPQSESEHLLVREATNEMFEYLRIGRILSDLAQNANDDVAREFPITDSGTRDLYSFRRLLLADDKFVRALDRRRSTHLRGYERLVKLLGTLRKQHPLLTAERPDLTPDSRHAEDVELSADAKAEIVEELTRCANEPNHRPYAYITQLLGVEGFMEENFPGFDHAKIRSQLGITPLPLAA